MRTREAIRADIDRIQREQDQIKTQIDMAKRVAASEGIWADPDWLTRAEDAKRIKGRQVQALLSEMSQARKQEKQMNIEESEARGKIFERAFISNARALLPPDMYSMVLIAAMAEAPK